MKKISKWLTFMGIVTVIMCFAAITASATDQNRENEFGYSLLTDNEKYIYDQIYEGVTATPPEEKIDLDYARAIELDELERAFSLFINDHPECFWISNSYAYSASGTIIVSVSPQYHFNGEELENAKSAFDQKTLEIMQGLPIGSNYDKALYLHDALASTVTYRQVGLHQTAYGALVDGEAVCAGYAAAYQHLLKRAGIKASTVTGYSVDPSTKENIPHAWNIVWMDENTCVYTDVTWDDQGDTVYHYYFNISRSEIDADHTTNTELHILPDCDHSNESYFDKNDCNVSFSTSPEEMALHFAAVNSLGERNAVIYYITDDQNRSFDAWLEENINGLYEALNGAPGSYSYGYSSFGNEYHVTLTGDFTSVYHGISIILPDNVASQYAIPEYVADGDSIYITVFAANGYYFPEELEPVIHSDYTVQRTNYYTVTISGKPRNDIEIAIPAPQKMTQEDMPSVTFTATGSNSGIIGNITAPIKISLDGESWYSCYESSLSLADLFPCTLIVVTMGSETTADSEPQYIVISKADAPTVTVVQPNADVIYGTISSSSPVEISTDGVTWSQAALEFSSLAPSTYLVRIAPSGSTLASDILEIAVVCSHVLPDEWDCDHKSHSRSCACGIKSESGSHSFGEWQEVLSNGSTTGKATRKCKDCGYEQSGNVSSSGNSSGSANKGTFVSNGSHAGTMKSSCSLSLMGSVTVMIISVASAFVYYKKRR